jgi:hypothetical protein
LTDVKETVIPPDLIFLSHRQVERQHNVQKAAAQIKGVNARKQAAARDKVSNSVSEADDKARQKALDAAADEIQASLDAEQAAATKPAARRRAATTKE